VNLVYLLDNSAEKYPNRTAIVCGEYRFSYQDLVARSSQLAKALLASGLKKQSRVAILSPNCHFFVESYFATVRAGMVAVLVNTRLTAQEIAYVLNDSQPEAIFFASEYEGTISRIKGDLNTVGLFITLSFKNAGFAFNYEPFLGEQSSLAFMEPAADSDPCQIVYTSGTTGRPKGAVLTHGNVIWNFFNIIFSREDPMGQKILIIGPLFHVAALNNQMTIHIGLGGTCILIRKFEPEAVLRVIQEEKVSVMVAAPTVYNFLIQEPNAQKYDTSSIKHLTSGADRLMGETKRSILSLFKGISGVSNVYGCTEATATIAVLRASESSRKGESVGRAAPFSQARIVNDLDEPLPPGEIGELVCRGPNLMQGYYGNAEATKEVIRNGWLHTGDLAYMDEEGYFYVIDRKKDMVISGGENIYPREVEAVLFTHPDIVDAAVVGVPDPFWGESVKAFVVRGIGSALDAEGVVEYCKSRLASYKKPKFVEFVDAIPRNPAGKALKKLLRDRK